MSDRTSVGNGKVLRKAGLLESYHIVRVGCDLDTGVLVSARYTHPSGRLDKETMYLALRVLVQNNRGLSVQVRDGLSSKPLWIGLDSVDLSRIVHFHEETSEHLQTIHESYLAKPFQYGTQDPLWRVAVLSDNNVLFMFHHAVGDGQSGLGFHVQLLFALNTLSQIQTKDTSPIVEIPPSLAFTLPVEKLMDLSVGFPVFWRVIRDTFVPVKFRKANRAWTGKKIPKLENKSFALHVRLFELSSEEAEILLRICRQNKSTFTAFFHTLGIVVMGDLIRMFNLGYKFITTDFAISLRRFTGKPIEAICDEASAWFMVQPIAKQPAKGSADDIQAVVDNFPWEDSASFASFMKNNLSKISQVTGCIKFLFRNFTGHYKGMLGKKRGTTFSLSNLGRFPDNNTNAAVTESGDSAWHMDSMFFSQCDVVLGGAMTLGVSTAESGSVGLAFSWSTNHGLDDDFAEKFVERYCAVIKAMIAQK
ncbi:hypothetical protein K474DRAFT_1667352 [Panus rudis PR-1116 ss-1]|nr:hypothetical protein K474DRAFT_1667352 [Panus rudis PR-1116 ss-1]